MAEKVTKSKILDAKLSFKWNPAEKVKMIFHIPPFQVVEEAEDKDWG